MMSPGSNGVTRDRPSIRAGTPKRNSLVRPFCRISSPIAHCSSMSSGSSNSSTVTTHGPIGAKPGKDLPWLNCGAGPRELGDSFGDVLPSGQAGTCDQASAAATARPVGR